MQLFVYKSRPQKYKTYLTIPLKCKTYFKQIYKTAVYGCFHALKNPNIVSGFLRDGYK